MDWSSSDLIYQDQIGDHPHNGVDLLGLDIADDTERVYFKFNLDRNISLQEDQAMVLFVDLDYDENTSGPFGIPGADLMYDFGRRRGQLFTSNQTDYTVFHNQVGLYTLPTVDSDTFEVSFSKKILLPNDTMHWGDTIRFTLLDKVFSGDRIPDVGTLPYPMTNSPKTLPEFNPDRKAGANFRLVTYNILSDGLLDTQRRPALQRLIVSLEPDILCLQEAYDISSFEVAQMMDTLLPLNDGSIWSVEKVNPDIITASRFPITEYAEIDGNGLFLLEVSEVPLYVVNAHLPCCDKETERQIEIDRILSFVRDSRDGLTQIEIPENSRFVMAGDMNLVGRETQLNSLRCGDIINENWYGPDLNLDWDGTCLEDAIPLVSFQPYATTWTNNFSSYPPARLDCIFYTGSVLELTNHYALNTMSIHRYDTLENGLLPNDTDIASDHLPVVADFRIKQFNSLERLEAFSNQWNFYPNPALNELTITVQSSHLQPKILQIFSLTGNLIARHVNKGWHEKIEIDISLIPVGVYIIQLSNDTYADRKLFIKGHH